MTVSVSIVICEKIARIITTPYSISDIGIKMEF